MTDVEWVYTKCPVCGLSYPYVKGGYKPKTCNRFECVRKFMHPKTRALCLEANRREPGGGDAY